MKLDKNDREDLREAKNLIYSAMRWDETPQGLSYWSFVCDNLENLIQSSEEKETEKECPKCEKTVEIFEKLNDSLKNLLESL